MMNRRAFFLSGPACLVGCTHEDKYHYHPTTNGHLLSWQNDGAVPEWFSMNEVDSRLDLAVDRAVAHLAIYGTPEALVRATARGYKYVGFDAARFKADASPTGWASGMYSGPSHPIALAFWSRAKGNDVPPDAPPWTAYQWPQRPDPAWDWGVEPPAFPALGHEIGHAIWGAAFEHGWTPPVVAGFSILAVKNWEGDCAYSHE